MAEMMIELTMPEWASQTALPDQPETPVTVMVAAIEQFYRVPGEKQTVVRFIGSRNSMRVLESPEAIRVKIRGNTANRIS